MPTLPSFPGPAGEADTRLFLSVDTPESIVLMYELWDKHSGLPGLLGFTDGKSEWSFDPANGSYTNLKTSRVITRNELTYHIRPVVAEGGRRMKKTTQQLISGIIILSVWYQEMRNLMRALYKTIFLLSIGGFLFEDEIARNVFYALVLLQFHYLDGFADQVSSGAQILNGSAMSRAGMYGHYGDVFWQNLYLYHGKEYGFTEGRRVLGPNENHCSDKVHPGGRPGCVQLAALGFVPLFDVVPIGDALCYSYCKCTIELR